MYPKQEYEEPTDHPRCAALVDLLCQRRARVFGRLVTVVLRPIAVDCTTCTFRTLIIGAVLHTAELYALTFEVVPCHAPDNGVDDRHDDQEGKAGRDEHIRQGLVGYLRQLIGDHELERV